MKTLTKIVGAGIIAAGSILYSANVAAASENLIEKSKIEEKLPEICFVLDSVAIAGLGLTAYAGVEYSLISAEIKRRNKERQYGSH